MRLQGMASRAAEIKALRAIVATLKADIQRAPSLDRRNRIERDLTDTLARIYSLELAERTDAR